MAGGRRKRQARKRAAPGQKRRQAPAFRSHPHLYEINTWAWLEGLSQSYGRRVTLGSVPEQEWERLRGLGFDFIWLMGVWQRSPTGREIALHEPRLLRRYDRAFPGWKTEDVVGSPYAVYAYAPDSQLGTWEELDRVRGALHARGMKLILDFVPNHTALDHGWVHTHPDYYVPGTEEESHRDPSTFFEAKTRGGKAFTLAHGRDPNFPAWTDTAQLNYFNPALRKAMLRELRMLARHCDGVRCDMAMLILNDVFARTWGERPGGFSAPAEEFWSQAVKALPGFVWIAEAYWDLEWRMQQLGFQFVYDKRLYDRLRHELPAAVRAHLQAEWEYQKGLLRFLENHDEERAATAFGERLPAAATLTATLPGLRFYHQGQLKGRQRQLPVQLGRAEDEPADEDLRAFYEKLLRVSDEKVFHDGDWQLLDVHAAGDGSWENLLAYRWCSSEALKVVVVNLGASPAQGLLPLAGEGIDSGNEYQLLDQLNEQRYERAGGELLSPGLYVRLEAGRAHLFDVRAGG